MMSWDEMSELEQLECTYCEMHKDVYGVKARWYRAESVEQARKDIDSLSKAMEQVMAEEQRRQAASIHDFEMVVLKHCGGDFEKAVRWQHDACNTNGDDEYLEYHLDLPYGYIKRKRLSMV
jgi:hypothetical protein